MRAAVYHGRGDVRIEEVALPEPAPGEVLVEVLAAGICGTDAHEYSHGPSMFPITERHPVTGHVGPLVPGHELVGRIEAVNGDVGDLAVGDLVVSGAGISCGTCPRCREGRTNLCTRYASVGLQRHGGLAERCALPAATCVRVDEERLTPDAAALAQPMAIAVHALRRSRLRADEVALIIGVGGIGAFLTYAASAMGAPVVVLDLSDRRLELARRLGAGAAFRPDQVDDLREHLRKAGEPRVVFEVSGTEPGLRTAVDLVGSGGRLVVVGLQGAPLPVDLRDLALRELEAIGTNAHVCDLDLPEAVRLLAAREEPWSDVAPTAIPLDRLVDDGLEPIAQGRSDQVKMLIDPRSTARRATQM